MFAHKKFSNEEVNSYEYILITENLFILFILFYLFIYLFFFFFFQI